MQGLHSGCSCSLSSAAATRPGCTARCRGRATAPCPPRRGRRVAVRRAAERFPIAHNHGGPLGTPLPACGHGQRDRLFVPAACQPCHQPVRAEHLYTGWLCFFRPAQVPLRTPVAALINISGGPEQPDPAPANAAVPGSRVAWIAVPPACLVAFAAAAGCAPCRLPASSLTGRVPVSATAGLLLAAAAHWRVPATSSSAGSPPATGAMIARVTGRESAVMTL